MSKEEFTDQTEEDKQAEDTNEASEQDAEQVSEDEELSIEEQLAQAQAQAEEYLDGWQRARAELSNVKKRIERERGEMHIRARVAVIARFLDVMDDLGRALDNAPQELADDSWTEGLLLVRRKFAKILEAEGVSEVEADGQEFDPAMHEAISAQESDEHEEGQIITVVQKGYALGDHIVRPALVIVAA